MMNRLAVEHLLRRLTQRVHQSLGRHHLHLRKRRIVSFAGARVAEQVPAAETVRKISAKTPVEVAQAGPEGLAHLPPEAAEGRDVADVAGALRRVRADDHLGKQRLPRAGWHGHEHTGRVRVQRPVHWVGDELALRWPERQDRVPVQGECLLDRRGEVGGQDGPDAVLAEPVGKSEQVRRDPAGIEVAEADHVPYNELEVSTRGVQNLSVAFSQVCDEAGDAA